MSSDKRGLGIIFALLSTFLWGGAFVVARLADGQISPLALSACRWLVAFLALCCFALPTVKKEWPVVKKFLPNLIVAALTGIALFAPLSYFAAQTTTAANMGLISVITPIFVLLILVFKGEKQSANTWIGCLVALLGSAYLVTGGNLDTIREMKFVEGDMIMLVATFGFAIYSISLRFIPEGLSQVTVITILAFLAILFMIPFVIWEYTTPAFVFNLNGTVLFSIAFTGLGASLAAWWCWNIGLELAGAALANIIYYALPLFSGILGFLILGEAISTTQMVSAGLIIGGIYWSTRK